MANVLRLIFLEKLLYKNNKNVFKKIVFICLIGAAMATSAFAQRWELGGWIGGTHYFGDINPDFGLNRPNIAFGAMTRHNFNSRISSKLSLNYGTIEAYDRDYNTPLQQARNLDFKSHIFDATAQIEFNFLPYQHGKRDENISPYVFVGGGAFHFNPRTKYNGQWVSLQTLGTEGQFIGSEYALLQPQLTYGLGLKLDLAREWSFNFEFSAKKLFTDYLDDVSGNYPDPSNLRSLHGDLAVALSDRSGVPESGIGQPTRQRGNGFNNDTYVFASLGLMYNFNSVRCTKW